MLEQGFTWHGCIFSNAPMARIMLARRKILKDAWNSINLVKVQDTHPDDFPWNWYMAKNMIVYLMLIIERSKYKIGAEQSGKH